MKKLKVVLLLNFILIYGTSFAQEEKRALDVGDQAPSLTIQEWVKGEPVNQFKKGQIYVVEFSGTWCPPCRKAIPHITEMAKKYAKDVKIVSVYNERNDKTKPEDLSYVKRVHALVNAMGNKMDFIVAADVPDQTTQDQWKIPFWPLAFVIDRDGKIVWKGDPKGLDDILSNVTRGTFNPADAIREQTEYSTSIKDIWNKKNGYQSSLAAVDSLILKYPEKKASLYYLKFHLLAGKDDKKAYEWLRWLLSQEISGFDWPHFINGPFDSIGLNNRNYELELEAIDRTIKESETKFHAASPLALKAKTLAKIGRYREAIEACRMAIESSKTQAGNDIYLEKYQSALIVYEYQLRTQTDVKTANVWLRKKIANKEVTLGHLFIAAVMETKNLDYDFALELLEDTLKGTKIGINKVAYLSKMADICFMKRDYDNAMLYAQKAIDQSKVADSESFTAQYEKKREELKQRINQSKP